MIIRQRTGGYRSQVGDKERWLNFRGPEQLESDNGWVNDTLHLKWTNITGRELLGVSLERNILRRQPNSLTW